MIYYCTYKSKNSDLIYECPYDSPLPYWAIDIKVPKEIDITEFLKIQSKYTKKDELIVL